MEGPQMLSGSQLVTAGVTKKIDGELPELGTKDVSPNGSWVEQKQIQSALEARKRLIEVERIEKIGSLSHAIWRDELNLAEVTQRAGSYWKYIGHNIGKHLFLRSEEALFLIELNCLLLKHNDVTVSLQKAYSLCLGDISVGQYKVYASLSRLGYRVFRHKQPANHNILTVKRNDYEVPGEDEMEDMESNYENHMKIVEAPFANIDDVNKFLCPLLIANNLKVEVNENPEGSEMIENDINLAIEKTLLSAGITPGAEHKGLGDEILPVPFVNHVDNENYTQNRNANMQINNEQMEPSACFVQTCRNTYDDTTATIDVDDNANERIIRNVESNNTDDSVVIEPSSFFIAGAVYSVDESGVIQVFEENTPMALGSEESKNLDPGSGTNDSIKHYVKDYQHYETKMQNYIKRKADAIRRTDLDGFNSMQDFYQQRIVNVTVPEEKYLPRNIFLHKAMYVCNMDIVRKQNASNTNFTEDEPEQMENRRRADRRIDSPDLADVFVANPPFNGPPRYNNPYPAYHTNYRPPPAWVRHSYNTYYNYNSTRPQSYMFQPRYRYHPQSIRQQLLGNNQSANFQPRSLDDMRMWNGLKMSHFKTISNIALRFKCILDVPSNRQHLKNLLNSYNSQYGENYQLTPDFDIIQGGSAQEVIVLDDDAGPQRKKRRVSDAVDPMHSNLEKLKALAAKLKDLHAKNLAVSRHRRVFSSALKEFNKSFKADLYLDTNFEIKDKKLIVLDTSSDSDVVIPVKQKEKSKKKRKLNPFNILKRVSKNVNVGASTSREVPILQQLSLKVINEGASTSQDPACDDKGTDSPIKDNDGEGLLKYFDKAWLPSHEDFGRAELYSRDSARLDTPFFEAEYLHEILKQSTEFQSWLDVKISVLKEIQNSTAMQEQQAIALNNDFFMETESQLLPIIGSECTDLRSALSKLAIIPTHYNVIPNETCLKIDFDVFNRDNHFKKRNPPKANFRVICWDETKALPSSDDVLALKAQYSDGVPSVFAIFGTGSISYLQINPVNLAPFIPDNDST